MRDSLVLLGAILKTRDTILEKLDQNDVAGAADLARTMLRHKPDDADLLGLLGLALEAAGDVDGAAEVLRKALTHPATPSIQLRNTTNLAALLMAQRKRGEATDLLRAYRSWPAGHPLGDNERQCMALIADIMAILGMNEELASMLESVVDFSAAGWPLARRHGVALAALERYEALIALTKDCVPQASHAHERHALLAMGYAKLGLNSDAVAARNSYLAGVPVYLAAPKPGQILTIGVINPVPGFDRFAQSPRSQHFNGNYPWQLADRLEKKYRFASIILRSAPSALDAFKRIPPDVIINNIANAEVLRTGDTLMLAKQFADAANAPVINHPERAVHCTRQINAELFATIPNVIAPKLKRFQRDLKRLDELVANIESSFEYPVIVRGVTEQEQKNIFLVNDRSSLLDILINLNLPQVYVIQYRGETRSKGCFRKMRAAFVDGVWTMMRVDYSKDWVTRTRRYKTTQDLYIEYPELLADANDIILRPSVRLGEQIMSTLNVIGQKFPLEVFGLDFDVDEAGRIVFFEANATMNLLGTGPADIAYPASADTAFVILFEDFIRRKVNDGGKKSSKSFLH